MIVPEIKTIPSKKLIGKCLSMSFSQNRTAELWKSFMMERKHILNSMSTDLFSLQEYQKPYQADIFDPEMVFTKWAATEVPNFDNIPEGMATYELKGGLYAVFLYKGHPAEGASMFQYIFTSWLPASGYELDDRAHFEVLGDKYKNNDPDSEEEIWVPVKTK
ncbi:MAG: GyrI-like domain-containing protein [Bacteroidota bacterium]